MKNTMKSLTRKTPLMVVFAIAMIAFGSAQAFATTFLVNPPEDNAYATCTPPTAANFTVSTLNTALAVALSGDIVYVCPKYATATATAANASAYNETIAIGAGVNVQGIPDNRGSRVVIASNPGSVGVTTAGGFGAIVALTGAGATFGNFVVDGAVGAANAAGPAGTNAVTTVNYTGTASFAGIVVGNTASGSIVYSNTVQNVRTGDTSSANFNGDGIVVRATSNTAANAAGTAANPVQINNNIVQNFRSEGIYVSQNAYAFVRGNYVIGNGNGRVNGVDQPGQTVNQVGVLYDSTNSNGDIFNNRITNIQLNQNTTAVPAANCTTITACPNGILLINTGSANGNALRVRFNSVSNTTVGIGGQDLAFANIASNNINSVVFDGIFLAGSTANLGSNFNTVSLNTITSARRAGIFLGLVGGDASLGNTIQQNTVQDAYSGVVNNPPAVNNTITNTGATANTYISVNLFNSLVTTTNTLP